MIQNETEFAVTLEKLGSLLEGLEALQANVLPTNSTLYAIQSESVMEDIGRLRQELQDYSSTLKVSR